MKFLTVFGCLSLIALPAFSTPVNEALLNKYCIDEACLFAPINNIPVSITEQSSDASAEINRLKSLPQSCDGTGVGSFGAISSSGKSLYLTFAARPEPQGKHFRVDLIRATVPGTYSKEQLLSVVRGMMKKFDFPAKEFVDMGSWVSVDKKDKGMSVQLIGINGPEGMKIELKYMDPSISSDAFARSSSCNSALPKF